MSRIINPAAALLLAGIASPALLLPQGARAQGPSGAGPQPGTQPVQVPSESPSRAPSKLPSGAPTAIASTGVPAKATLADLAWLAGSWQGSWGPRVAQQIWAAPGAGVMLGTFQLAENGKTLVVELFSIAETPDGIELRIRHFTPSLVPWEKDGPTVLRLATADARSAVFENPVNGDPRTQTFRRVDADTYASRSEVVPPEGDPQIAEITFRRARGDATPAKGKRSKKPE